MRIANRFNPEMREGKRVSITLKATVLGTSRDGALARIRLDATNDELTLCANDELKIEFIFDQPPFEVGAIYKTDMFADKFLRMEDGTWTRLTTDGRIVQNANVYGKLTKVET